MGSLERSLGPRRPSPDEVTEPSAPAAPTKVLILGATGPTGRHVLDRALALDDAVTVLARRPEALADYAERVTVLKGDATSPDDVARAMTGQDAVISALGTGRSRGATTLFSQAAKAVITASQRTGVTRLIWMSSAGAGDTVRNMPAASRIVFWTLLRKVYANKAIADKVLQSSDLEWTIVYPSVLTDGPATGSYRVGDHLMMTGVPRVSRADVADFMCKAAHDPTWIRGNALITG